MRVQLAELQRRYKEKQRELARLQRRHDHEYGPGWQWVGRAGAWLVETPPVQALGQMWAQPSPGPPPCGKRSTCVCWDELGQRWGPGRVPRGSGRLRRSLSGETKGEWRGGRTTQQRLVRGRGRSS